MFKPLASLWNYLLCVLGVRAKDAQRVEPRKPKGVEMQFAPGEIVAVEKDRIILAPQKPAPAVSDKEHPLDDLSNWGKEFTYVPPLSKADIATWQGRFDRAFGLNRDGKSCFKLVWSGDRKYWHRYAYDWDAYGKGIKWEERPRILWKKIDIGNGDYFDMFPPRWLILMRIEPEQYADQWKKESWVWDPRRNQNKQIRDDEVPRVFWDTFEVIGEHDEYCCEVFKGECFGVFRNPSDKDLQKLNAMKREFEARDQSPYEALSAKTEAEIARFTRDYFRQQYQRMPASTEIVVENATEYLKPFMQFTGETLSENEQKQIVKSALDRHYTEKAEEYEQRLRSN